MIHFGKAGFLKIILGSMFSGKTSELLNIHRHYQLCKIKCCVIEKELYSPASSVLLTVQPNNGTFTVP